MTSPRLSESNEALLRRVGEGDEQALEALLRQNEGLLRAVARRFLDRGAEWEDLLQIGSIGMIKAARSFDFSFGTAFSTYAVPLVAGEIRRFLRDDGPVKVGRGLRRTCALVMKERERLLALTGREPRLGEVGESLGLSPEEVAEALEAGGPIRSLQEPVDGEEGLTFGDLLPSGECEIDRLTDRIALREAVKRLTPLQQEIVSLRFYRDMSQQKTGQLLGLSQVKISREEKKILTALRSFLL